MIRKTLLWCQDSRECIITLGSIILDIALGKCQRVTIQKNIYNNIYNNTVINNGNKTEWSPIRSVIIRVITKSDDRAAGVRFVYHEYDYKPNWTTRSPIAN